MSKKTLNIITIVLFVVSVIVGIFTFTNTSAIEKGESGLVNPLLFWTYLLLCITVVLVLFLPLPSIIKNPKSLKQTLFVILGIIVAFGIVYALSQGTPVDENGKAIETIWDTMVPQQQDEYKANFLIANMNIIAAEIALILSVVAILWSLIKGYVKK
ncbi:MAG: hypothetical protein LBS69_02215 [Prevotellaceae bacterium]|jgi:hypothetical protein|nr:hypothetical protein [Prevotellaceae bacterium]